MTKRTRKMFALVSIISLLFGMNVSAADITEAPEADKSTGQVKITVVPDDSVDVTALSVGESLKMKIVLENQSEMDLSPEIVVTSEIDGKEVQLGKFLETAAEMADEALKEALYEVKKDVEFPTVLVKDLKAQEKAEFELEMEWTVPEGVEGKEIILHVKAQNAEEVYGELELRIVVKAAEEEKPEVPPEEEKPEEPKVPETPTEEEKPEEPENPVEEEKPEEPENPTEEEKPEEPENPTEEEKPEEPENPTEEEKPEEPENPTEEEKPEEPENPTEEEKPEEPENPTEEEKPEEPEEPSEEDKQKEEEQKQKEEELKKKEEELKKKEEELKKKEAEEKKKAEEAKKAAEKKKAEEARKAAEAARKKSATPHTGDETDAAPALLGILMAVAAVARRKR